MTPQSKPQGYIPNDPNAGDVSALQAQVQLLSGQVSELQQMIGMHAHDGVQASNTNFDNLLGSFEVVSVAPTSTPTRASKQIKIYTNGTTLRLYWFDTNAGVWHYVTATA